MGSLPPPRLIVVEERIPPVFRFLVGVSVAISAAIQRALVSGHVDSRGKVWYRREIEGVAVKTISPDDNAVYQSKVAFQNVEVKRLRDQSRPSTHTCSVYSI